MIMVSQTSTCLSIMSQSKSPRPRSSFSLDLARLRPLKNQPWLQKGTKEMIKKNKESSSEMASPQMNFIIIKWPSSVSKSSAFNYSWSVKRKNFKVRRAPMRPYGRAMSKLEPRLKRIETRTSISSRRSLRF